MRATLARALELGGSTLRDFRDVHGMDGAFQAQAQVYGRDGAALPALRRHRAAHRAGAALDLLLRRLPAAVGSGKRTAAGTNAHALERPLSGVVSRCRGRVTAALAWPLHDAKLHRLHASTSSPAGAATSTVALPALAEFLADHDLVDDADAGVLTALRERLASDKLVLAFVAEFSRGKSELINAIFFADTGRRVLPATPGRTTMCPVELFYDADAAGAAVAAADRDPAARACR